MIESKPNKVVQAIEHDVYAQIVDTGSMGRRVKKVWVELITDEQIEQMETERLSNLN